MEMKIIRKVQGHLIDHVGEMAMAGTPSRDCASGEWRVPVLVSTPQGVFPVGEFVLDEHGEFVAVPSKEQMLRVLENSLKRQPFLVYGDREELEAKGVELVAA